MTREGKPSRVFFLRKRFFRARKRFFRPPGMKCPLEDLDSERDWAHESDDFEIVRVSVGFLPAGEGSVRCGGVGAAAAVYGGQNSKSKTAWSQIQFHTGLGQSDV